MLLLPLCASAQPWRSVVHTAAAQGLPELAALVSNEQGHSIRISMADDKRVMAVFQLPDGLLALDSASCPTFKVDTFEPEALHLPAGRCIIEDNRATIEIVQVIDGKVDSEVLLQLLNGEDLKVLYRLEHAGYSSAGFSLKRSKSVLLSALPKGTVIVGD